MTATRRKIGLRAAWGIALAASLLAGNAYWHLRHAPARDAALALSREAALERTVRDLAARVKVQREQVAGLEARFAPLDHQEPLRALSLEVSSFAERTGVLVRENMPFGGDPKAKAARRPSALGGYLDGKPYRRPLARLVVDASFPKLRRFLEGLGGLSRRVTVVRLDVDADESAAGSLRATLVLAL